MIIIITSCYLLLEIFNILFFIARFHLDKILSYYKEQNIYVTEEDWRDGTGILVAALIFSLIDIGYFFQGIYLIIYFSDNIKEVENEKIYENRLQPQEEEKEETNKDIIQPLTINN